MMIINNKSFCIYIYVGFYSDHSVLQCDSYLGISFFTVGVVLVVYCIAFYSYFFYSVTSLVAHEFKLSKFIYILGTYIYKYHN